MDDEELSKVTIRARELYKLMPGATIVPCDRWTDYKTDWSAVEYTDHYLFCEAIATMIEELAA